MDFENFYYQFLLLGIKKMLQLKSSIGTILLITGKRILLFGNNEKEEFPMF